MFWLLKNAVFQGKLTTRIKALLPQCAIVSDVVILNVLLCSGISGLESTDQGCPNTIQEVVPAPINISMPHSVSESKRTREIH